MLRTLRGVGTLNRTAVQFRRAALPAAPVCLLSSEAMKDRKHLGLLNKIKRLSAKKDYNEIVELVQSVHLPDFLQTCIADTYRLYDEHMAKPLDSDQNIALQRSPFSQLLEAFTRCDDQIGALAPQTAWGMMELTRDSSVLAQSVSIVRLTKLCSMVAPNPEAPTYVATRNRKWNNQNAMVEIMADWFYYAKPEMRKTYLKRIIYDFLPDAQNSMQRDKLLRSFMKAVSVAETTAGGDGNVTAQCLFTMMQILRKPQKLARLSTQDLGEGQLITRKSGTTMGHMILKYMMQENLLNVKAITVDSFADVVRSYFKYPLYMGPYKKSADASVKDRVRRVNPLDQESMIILWNVISKGNSLQEVVLRENIFDIMFKEEGSQKESSGSMLMRFTDSFKVAMNNDTVVCGGTGEPKLATHTMDGTPLLLSSRVSNLLMEGFIRATVFNMAYTRRKAGKSFDNLKQWVDSMRKMRSLPEARAIMDGIADASLTSNTNGDKEAKANITFGTNKTSYVQLFACFNSDVNKERMGKQRERFREEDKLFRERRNRNPDGHRWEHEKHKHPAYYTAHDILAMMARDKLMPDGRLLNLLGQGARRDRDFAMSKKVLHMAHALCYAIPRMKVAKKHKQSPLNEELQPSTGDILREEGNEQMSLGKKSILPNPMPLASTRHMGSTLLNSKLAALNERRLNESCEYDPDIPDPITCSIGDGVELLSDVEMAMLYNMAIDNARLSRKNVDSVYLLLAMARLGLRPDSQALFYIFRALQDEDQHLEVLRLYELMSKWGIKHENRHMVCKLESLTALGKLSEAYELLKLVQTDEMLNAPQTNRSRNCLPIEVPPRDMCKPYTFMKLFDFLLWALTLGGPVLRDARPGPNAKPFNYQPHKLSREDLIDAAVEVAIMGLKKTANPGPSAHRSNNLYFDTMKCSILLSRVDELSKNQITSELARREPELTANFLADLERERMRIMEREYDYYSYKQSEYESQSWEPKKSRGYDDAEEEDESQSWEPKKSRGYDAEEEDESQPWEPKKS